MSEAKFDIQKLLNTDRELTPEEFEALRTEAEATWSTINDESARLARQTYASSSPQEFTECVLRHMSTDECLELVRANMYSCPHCGRLLKDRGRPE